MKPESDYQYSRLEKARAKVERLKGFYTHFVIYLIFIPVFIYLNIKSGGFPWALFPILGWGLGVAGHASEVFEWNPFFGRRWEERKIKEFIDKDQLNSF